MSLETNFHRACYQNLSSIRIGKPKKKVQPSRPRGGYYLVYERGKPTPITVFKKSDLRRACACRDVVKVRLVNPNDQ